MCCADHSCPVCCEQARLNQAKVENPHKFWMLFVEGNGVPTKRHFTKASAEAAATRLITTNATKVYVLEVVDIAEPSAPPVKWSKP